MSTPSLVSLAPPLVEESPRDLLFQIRPPEVIQGYSSGRTNRSPDFIENQVSKNAQVKSHYTGGDYASSSSSSNCFICSGSVAADGNRWLGRKNLLAIIVGTTALAITAATISEYCC